MTAGPVADRVAERVPTMVVDGLRFRDLDGDGELAPYEDWRLPAEQRVGDLVGRMTLAEKAATMVHGTAPAVGSPLGSIGIGTGYDLAAIEAMVVGLGLSSLITRLSLPPAEFAAQNNAIQAVAATGRLGIPVIVSSDPRHHVGGRLGASHAADGFSQWPETLGLAAIGDRSLVQRFGDVVRREYRAVGIHMALSPQADLATSPRWPRTDGTFGENPALVRALTGAYVEGIQGGRSGVTAGSVAAVVKHWVGYGASRDGFDGHNWYGRHSAFPSGALADHVEAFLDALAFGVAGVMPTYNILDGVVLDGAALEPVGAGFSRQLVEGLLRTTHGYRGMVLSDWAITRDMTESARTGNPPQAPDAIAMPWGVEALSSVEKFAKAIAAGVDQIGGENDPAPIVHAVEQGLVPVGRIDAAATAVLLNHVRLGLFDDPFVDEAGAGQIVGSFTAEAQAAQRRSIVVLTGHAGPMVAADDVVFVDGLDAAAFAGSGPAVTDDLATATRAVVAVTAPHQVLHPTHFFGALQHEGDLDYPADHADLRRVQAAAAAVPTVVVAHLDRPAVLAPIVEHADAVVVTFGVTADVVADVLTGRATAEGHLPFRLPSTMADALAQPCDRPDERIEPLFPFGHPTHS